MEFLYQCKTLIVFSHLVVKNICKYFIFEEKDKTNCALYYTKMPLVCNHVCSRLH